ncbi:MAG TPA: PEP-CTERM sorting domain-containing protein [Phycisphaerae bacterium]|nr:PEP-CTERM sorting domain-containing protein [Phycisphaerae bacterium]
MKKFGFVMMLVTLAACSTTGWAYTFDQVSTEFWAGTGGSEAMCILDFGGGNSYAFGYRWDGDATGWDMLQAVVAASGSTFTYTPITGTMSSIVAEGGSIRLEGTQYSFGSIVEKLTYNGHTLVDDYYGTGESICYWVSGYADYTEDVYDATWTKIGEISHPGDPTGDGTDWFAPPTFGASGRPLSDGWWDGYTQVNELGNTYEPAVPMPEPTTLALLGAGAALLIRRRRR